VAKKKAKAAKAKAKTWADDPYALLVYGMDEAAPPTALVTQGMVGLDATMEYARRFMNANRYRVAGVLVCKVVGKMLPEPTATFHVP
jgi:hypothetical protein